MFAIRRFSKFLFLFYSHSIIEAENKDLFVIQNIGDDNLYLNNENNLQSKKGDDVKKVDDLKLEKLINEHKLFKKLEPSSKVPAIKIQRGNTDKRRTIYNDDAKIIKYWKDKKDSIEQAKAIKESKRETKKDTKLLFKNNYDLWDNENEDKIKIKVPARLRQKPSLLPAIEAPLPGQSYNPNPDDYNSLVLAEAEKEMQFIKEEQKLANKVDKYFVTKDQAPNEQTWLNEMSQGLFDKDTVDVDVDGDNIEMEMANFAKITKKKTKSQKRRELREKLAAKQRQKEKMLRIKENDVFRIKSINKELDQREKRIKERAKRREIKRIQALYKPKRLSRYRFEEKMIDINMPNEITGSLRTMKPEGNILMDRFQSFQKRNIIETRAIQLNKRKYKIKMEMKRRHRDEI